jgi:hypothetical protein
VTRDCSIAELVSAYRKRKFIDDLALELESYAGERPSCVEEINRFLTIKGSNELLQRICAARRGKTSYVALKSVAQAMREYGLERPALFAATCRIPTTETLETRNIYDETRQFMVSLFTECGLHESNAEDAFCILRSLVRGFVLHETSGAFVDVLSCEHTYQNAVEVFIAGLAALNSPNDAVGPVCP